MSVLASVRSLIVAKHTADDTKNGPEEQRKFAFGKFIGISSTWRNLHLISQDEHNILVNWLYNRGDTPEIPTILERITIIPTMPDQANITPARAMKHIRLLLNRSFMCEDCNAEITDKPMWLDAQKTGDIDALCSNCFRARKNG